MSRTLWRPSSTRAATASKTSSLSWASTSSFVASCETSSRPSRAINSHSTLTRVTISPAPSHTDGAQHQLSIAAFPAWSTPRRRAPSPRSSMTQREITTFSRIFGEPELLKRYRGIPRPGTCAESSTSPGWKGLGSLKGPGMPKGSLACHVLVTGGYEAWAVKGMPPGVCVHSLPGRLHTGHVKQESWRLKNPSQVVYIVQCRIRRANRASVVISSHSPSPMRPRTR